MPRTRSGRKYNRGTRKVKAKGQTSRGRPHKKNVPDDHPFWRRARSGRWGGTARWKLSQVQEVINEAVLQKFQEASKKSGLEARRWMFHGTTHVAAFWICKEGFKVRCCHRCHSPPRIWSTSRVEVAMHYASRWNRKAASIKIFCCRVLYKPKKRSKYYSVLTVEKDEHILPEFLLTYTRSPVQ